MCLALAEQKRAGPVRFRRQTLVRDGVHSIISESRRRQHRMNEHCKWQVQTTSYQENRRKKFS